MSRFRHRLLGFLGKIEIDTNVSLSLRHKVLAAICWGCLFGNHIAYLFRTALATQSSFNLEATIGVEVYITVAALICWRALGKRSSQ